MPPYLLLFVAVLLDVAAITALTASAGFTKAGPGAVAVLCYALSFYILSLALKTIPVGIAYAIWAGLGTVLIAAVGIAVFGQRLDWPAIGGIALIVAGIVVIRLFSRISAY